MCSRRSPTYLTCSLAERGLDCCCPGAVHGHVYASHLAAQVQCMVTCMRVILLPRCSAWSRLCESSACHLHLRYCRACAPATSACCWDIIGTGEWCLPCKAFSIFRWHPLEFWLVGAAIIPAMMFGILSCCNSRPIVLPGINTFIVAAHL